jgi:serine/threonine-protein kinase PknK
MLRRYETVRSLGEGAAGEVLLVRDRLSAGREVALKRLRGTLDESLRRAFEREFATMAALTVPGVAQVYDFGVMREGKGEERSFFTRAYVDGLPLDQVARTASPSARIAMVCRVGEVIAPLHRIGIVHGDIKPGNAIIDAEGNAHVIDFGLARVLGERSREVDGASGTLPLMAPELLRGERASIASDVFALGVTLWLLLTGELPYGRHGFLGNVAPPDPTIPEALDAVSKAALNVARRAIAREAHERLPTIDELLVALREAVPEAGEQHAQNEGARGNARVFVPPRARGHEESLARVEALTEASAHGKAATTVLLTGPLGAGKSRLLRELKWRMQLRGAHVLEVAVTGDDPGEPLAALVRQLEVAPFDDPEVQAGLSRASEAAEQGTIDRSSVSDALASAFDSLHATRLVLVLVDDIDRAEAAFGALLRSSAFAESRAAVAVVATAADADALAARSLSAEHVVKVAPLDASNVEALARDVLGSVDGSVLEALTLHAQGLPGVLVDALAALSQGDAPTAADVARLAPSDAGLALAQARLRRIPLAARGLVEALAVLGGSLHLDALKTLFPGVPIEAWIGSAEAAGVLGRDSSGVRIADVALINATRSSLGSEGERELAGKLLAQAEALELDAVERARLSVRAGDAKQIAALVPHAARELVNRGAHGAAAELYAALLEATSGAERDHAALELARCRHALGQLESAATLAAEVAESKHAPASLTADAAIVNARARTAQGRFDDAIAALSRLPRAIDGEAEVRARVLRELAKVHQRRGDYKASAAAAAEGLSCATDLVVRAELLCAHGMAASYRGDHDLARTDLEQAVSLARQARSTRDEASARATLAVARWRVGDFMSARDEMSQCLEIARELGDVGNMAIFSVNLGGLLFLLGEPAGAAEHYERASKLALRAGRLSTEAQAKNNLAHVHIYFGLYERAKLEVRAVLEHARSAGQRYIEAQGTVLLGDLSAREGDIDKALIHYDQGIALYAQLGQTREVADHNLDAAEALLDRGGPADASAAVARLAAAREPIEQQGLADLKLRHALLVGRARVASGDAEGALQALERVIEQARSARNRDVEWSGLYALASAHDALGAGLASRRHHRLAAEVLEDISLHIPREHRDAFWRDPRRRRARERALASEASTETFMSTSADVSALLADPRAERLLEIIKRLASEHDLDRLLERITESAVDLSGAERGFVLLVDARGQLEKRTVQVARAAEPDPHEAFSRSIAEAVLIDGEAIVTVDATRDGRLSEYVSVHKLMLRSVACLPIRSRSATVGVLYLEHRRSRGRFSDASVELLGSFADQAAIALENARLLSENRRRQQELEALNAELLKAKQGLEELLTARTEQLAEAQRELGRSRSAAREASTRHGMVGRSQAMTRVFDAIDRLQSSAVPVVVQGESGTGKELVARAIHYGGLRGRAPFVTLNCGSIPEALLESELFGHVRGAFSGADRDKRGLIARASGGTLFLDEIGDMPAKMQIDLLRVLQERKVTKVGGDEEEVIDVRFVSASQHRLEELVRLGRFREDLFYRLNVVEIALPPLRARREDIPLLCDGFLDAFAARDGVPGKRLTKAALERLLTHPFPGNVRQLEHILLQAWVMAEGPRIDLPDLALDEPSEPVSAPISVLPPLDTLPQSLDDHRNLERTKILAALEANGWNRARAARALGVPRRTFYRRLREYRILTGEADEGEEAAI